MHEVWDVICQNSNNKELLNLDLFSNLLGFGNEEDESTDHVCVCLCLIMIVLHVTQQIFVFFFFLIGIHSMQG